MVGTKRVSPLYIGWIVLLAIALLGGLVTAYKVLTVGHVIYGGNDVLFWTLPLATYMFFALTSTGLTFVASIPLVFGIKRYEPVAKRAVFLAIAALIAAFVSLLLETGSPLNMINYLTSPNLTSTLWWMGMLYGSYLALLLAMFWKMHTGNASKALGIVAFGFAVAASSTLGASIGLTEARPAFFGAFTPVYFLLTALLGGLAAFVLFSLVRQQLARSPLPESQTALYNELGRIFGFVIGITLLFFIWRTIVGLSATYPGFGAFKYIVSSWPFRFELWLGLVVPLILMLVPSVRAGVIGKLTASTLVLLGLFSQRMELLLTGQIMPDGPMAVGLPEIVSYTPTIWEWLVVASALAAMLLLYTLGERYLKLAAAPKAA
jgi:molybdopterin-containing oxidoreductase family membrane subunit